MADNKASALNTGIARADNAWKRALNWIRTPANEMGEWDPRVIETLRVLNRAPINFFFAISKAKDRDLEKVISAWYAAAQAFEAAVLPQHLAEQAEKNLRKAQQGGDLQAQAVLVLGGRVAALTGSKVQYLRIVGAEGETETLKEAAERLLAFGVSRKLALEGDVLAPLISSELFTQEEAVAIIKKAKGETGGTGTDEAAAE